MKTKIQQLIEQVNSFSASTLDEAEALRIKYLSKKGEISTLFNDFRNVPNEEKREVGVLLNELKNKAQDKINELKELLTSVNKSEEKADLTRTSNDFNVMLSTEISKVEKDMKETLESQLSNYQHQQRADNATKIAELAQAQKEVDLYKQQIQRLETELVAARELVEKVANAGKIGSINIPTGR